MRLHVVSIRGIFVAAVLTARGFSQVPPRTVEDRLRDLEATVSALKSENAELRRELGSPAAAGARSSNAAAVVVPFGRESRLAVGGYLQAQAEFGDAGDSRWTGTADRFYFRRARMYVTGSFAENFAFKVEGEFAANSLTASTGLRAFANELFIAWTRIPEANLRFGQVKPAFGGEQLMSDRLMVPIERFLASDRLTDSRQLGISVGGALLDRRLSYLIVVGNGNGPNVSANDNNKFMHTARVAFTPFDDTSHGRLTLAVNGMHTDDAAVTRPGLGFDSVPGGAVDNIFSGQRTSWGTDAVWHWRLLDVNAEFLHAHFDPKNHLPMPSFDAQGWTVAAGCFVIPQTLQAMVRRESFDPNTSLPGNQTNNWVLGMNYLIKGEDLRLMVNYIFGHNADAPKESGRLLTRFQVLF